MAWRDRRERRQLQDPVRGVFEITDFYDAHPSSSGRDTRLTGVIRVPGMPAVAAEHRPDRNGKWTGLRQVPVLVDRADPSRFSILWEEVQAPSWRDQAMGRAAAEAERANQSPPATGGAGPGAFVVHGTEVGDGAEVATSIADAIQSALGGDGSPFQVTVGSPDTVATEGLTATATVTGVRDLDVPAYLLPPGSPGMADLTLQVARPDGSAYQAVTRLGFSTPERRARIATVGAVIPVRVDPDDPGRTVVDVAALFGGGPSNP